MAAILCDSVAVVIVVVVRTRPRAIPLAMITMGKSIHGFSFLSYMCMGIRLEAAGAPLKVLDSRLPADDGDFQQFKVIQIPVLARFSSSFPKTSYLISIFIYKYFLYSYGYRNSPYQHMAYLVLSCNVYRD